MINFNDVFGTKKVDQDKNKPEMVYFKNKEEAERETGYFKVSSIQVTPELAKSILSFVQRNGLQTFAQISKKKTSYNHYTLKFTMRQYYASPGRGNHYKYCWIERGVTQGNLTSLRKTTITRRTDANGEIVRTEHGPSEMDSFQYDLVKSKTPDLNQLYFWICQKYPNHLKRMSYERIMPSYLEGVELTVDDYKTPVFDDYPRD
ncbi:hypothetical protein ALQ37_200134 [Pseudomonas syringae pv. aptata]|uniref:Uncharacterized protein n=1 Tax=Pseudomonas syringae pv. aptata TaxID=83167 RepID=A0A3M3X730_PSEAP|nr:hypothetical protein [Pseudomonas syringae]RMO65374.1 hypothetical protein ALQ37_200134 [Pseudomonas syringae pv. aptata]